MERNRRSSTFQPKCYRCGKLGHLANDRLCPGWKVTCINCKRKDHFTAVCKGKSDRIGWEFVKRTKPERCQGTKRDEGEASIDRLQGEKPGLQDLLKGCKWVFHGDRERQSVPKSGGRHRKWAATPPGPTKSRQDKILLSGGPQGSAWWCTSGIRLQGEMICTMHGLVHQIQSLKGDALPDRKPVQALIPSLMDWCLGVFSISLAAAFCTTCSLFRESLLTLRYNALQ